MAKTDNTAALRATILSLSQRCPKGAYPPGVPCPFLQLAALSYDGRKDMLAQMDHAALLSLFELASPCCCPADPHNAPLTEDKAGIDGKTGKSERAGK